MTDQWKCTVCGYVHDGEEPPETCPRCGAERSQFIPVEKEKVNLLRDMIETLVPHVVASHFPTGLIPSGLLFLLLSLLVADAHFEPAAFYALVVALVVAPVSLATGIYDWQTRFKGMKSTIFYKKIALAAALVVLGLVAALLRILHPEAVSQAGALRGVYLALWVGMAGCVVLLGHYGGKLAFKWKKANL